MLTVILNIISYNSGSMTNQEAYASFLLHMSIVCIIVFGAFIFHDAWINYKYAYQYEKRFRLFRIKIGLAMLISLILLGSIGLAVAILILLAAISYIVFTKQGRDLGLS